MDVSDCIDFNKNSLNKLILNKELAPEKVGELLDISLEKLLNEVYKNKPTKISKTNQEFNTFHNEKINSAEKCLRKHEKLDPFFKSSKIIVNGIPCPSIPIFLDWLNKNNSKIYISNTLYCIHGNFDLENIFIINSGSCNSPTPSFANFDKYLYGFPHYDFSKLLLNLEGYYDEITYGLYTLEYNLVKDVLKINLNIKTDYNVYYSKCLGILLKYLSQFSKIEGVTEQDFTWMIHTTECIHLLSLCSYELNKDNDTIDYNKIFAFLSQLCLKAKMLIETHRDETILKIYDHRLRIKLEIYKELEEMKEESDNFKNFIAIIGAGVSYESFLPTANELTINLKEHFKGIDSAENLGQAAFLIDDKEELKNFLYNMFKSKEEPADAHILLANLNLPCYVSLNFDELLEKAIERIPRNVDKIINNNSAMIPYSNSAMVIKPHGTISVPSSLHVSSEETLDFFEENPIIANMLVSQLANKTLLFIGFSFSDPDFLGLLRYLKKHSGKYTPKGYAVMYEKTRYQEKLCKEFNIKIIQSDATEFLIKLNETIQKNKQDIVPWEKYPLFFDQLQKGGIPTEIQIVKSIVEKIKLKYYQNANIKILKKEVENAIDATLKYRPHYALIHELKNKIENVNSRDDIEWFINEFDKYDSNKIKNIVLETFDKSLHLLKKDIHKDKIKILLYSRSQSVINFLKEYENSLPENIKNVELYISECGPRSILHYEDAITYIRQLQPTNYKITLLPDALIFSMLQNNNFDLVFLGAHFVYRNKQTKELEWFTNTVGSGAIVDFAKKSHAIVYVVFEDKKIHDKYNKIKLKKECEINFNSKKQFFDYIPSDVLIPEDIKEHFNKHIRCLKLQHDIIHFEENKVLPVIINYNTDLT